MMIYWNMPNSDWCALLDLQLQWITDEAASFDIVIVVIKANWLLNWLPILFA